ncbi:hypothetical protein [Haloarcula amylovorans]|uniref:hypothetical protein n=1 Tax=Haloarcula amylovorans TaxID=2562280 RepID=UPI001FD8295E|nr:hypothetical protein [Halomicroarcula amylolytica]
MTDPPHDVLRDDPNIGPLVEAHGTLTLSPADDDVLRDAGLSRQKTRYVNEVVEVFE